jgi:predicted enzyme related to lactoylglutathione lyase
LVVADPQAAAAFYGALFGWTWAPRAEPNHGVLRALLDGRSVADLVASSHVEPVPQGWVVGFAAVDARKLRNAALGMGATPERSMLRDPWGARFCLCEPDDGTSFGVAHEPGAYDWCDLFAPYGRAALRFYAELFSADRSPIDPADARDTDGFLVVGERPELAVFERPDLAEAFWMPFFEVDDAEGACERCQREGGQVEQAPADTPYGHIAHLCDPSGVRFGVNSKGDARVV